MNLDDALRIVRDAVAVFEHGPRDPVVDAARFLADLVDPPTYAAPGDEKVHAARYDLDAAGDLWRRVLCGGLVPALAQQGVTRPPFDPEAPHACASCVRRLPPHRRPSVDPAPAERAIRARLDRSRFEVRGDLAPGGTREVELRDTSTGFVVRTWGWIADLDADAGDVPFGYVWPTLDDLDAAAREAVRA